MWTQSWWSSSPGHCPGQDPVLLQHLQWVGDAQETNCPLDGFWSIYDSVRWSVKTGRPHCWPSSSSATGASYYLRWRWFVMRSYLWKGVWPLKKKPCISAICVYLNMNRKNIDSFKLLNMQRPVALNYCTSTYNSNIKTYFKNSVAF